MSKRHPFPLPLVILTYAEAALLERAARYRIAHNGTVWLCGLSERRKARRLESLGLGIVLEEERFWCTKRGLTALRSRLDERELLALGK